MSRVVVSAHNPMTGPRHLGHYVSSMRDWANHEHDDLYIVIDDLIAALLYPKSRGDIQEHSLAVAAEFIACEADADRTHVVLTSMIPEALEAMTLLSMEFEEAYCRSLYGETYAGLLDSYRRREVGLSRLPSVAEVVYPQLALASLVLILDADGFQGGEEMLGYMGIMEDLAERLDFLRAPEFIPGSTTYLRGTDGQHMANHNALFISGDESYREEVVASIDDPGICAHWRGALGEEYDPSQSGGDLEKERRELAATLTRVLDPFRERCHKLTGTEIGERLEEGSIITRTRARRKLAALKRHYGLPGFVH